MVSRICAVAALRHIANYSLKFRIRPAFTHLRYHRKCFLHTKIFDKDVDLNSRRENRQTLRGEYEQPNIINITEAQKEIINKTGEGIKLNAEENPDIFGNASIEEKNYDGDLKEDEFLKNPTRKMKKLRTIDYARQIKDCLHEKRLKDAINVLERKMLKEDRAKPDHYIYNLLISGCAKAGYTRKAFSLFNKMKQRGLKVTGGVYTSLFNACANAPSPKDVWENINSVREIMLEKGYTPNVKNYNAMIKAFGRCGDVKNAYEIADEMMDKNLPIQTDTFNFLLQACASEYKYGFRHCLLTWQKMIKRGVVPDFYSFSIVLRCTRDCSIGDIESMQSAIQEILEIKQIAKDQQNDCLKIESGSCKEDELNQSISSKINLIDDQKEPLHESITISTTSDEKKFLTESQKSKNPFSCIPRAEERKTTDDSLRMQNSLSTSTELSLPQLTNNLNMLTFPNLLSRNPHLGSLINLEEVKLPHERLILLGGLHGFLEEMKTYKITPGIETFTLLLEVIPPTNAAEKQLISYIRKIGLKSDIDFFNILIKKRSMRFDYDGAKEVISMIKTAGLYPDIVTYGVLALGCDSAESSRDLIQQMRDKGIRMNIQILGAMLRQGCSKREFEYVCEILQISLEENIKPNDIFLRHLNNFYKQCARAIDARHPYTKNKTFKKGHAKFCEKLNLWYEEHGIAGLKLEDAIRKIKERPYEQYKEDDIEGLEDIKNVKLARKRKFRKYIKKIKIRNLKDDDSSLNSTQSSELSSP